MNEKREVIMNKPSPETMRRVYEFFMRTSIPRILAAQKAQQMKEVTANVRSQQSHQANCAHN